MAEINAKDLTAKTSPASTDSMLLFGTTSNEGAKITVDNLADDILGRLATKTFPNQVGGSSAATILAQLATLNSNLMVGNPVQLCSPITQNGTYTLNEAFSNYKLIYIVMFKDSNIYASIFQEALLGAGYKANISQAGYNLQLTFSRTSFTAVIDGASSVRIFGLN